MNKENLSKQSLRKIVCQYFLRKLSQQVRGFWVVQKYQSVNQLISTYLTTRQWACQQGHDNLSVFAGKALFWSCAITAALSWKKFTRSAGRVRIWRWILGFVVNAKTQSHTIMTIPTILRLSWTTFWAECHRWCQSQRYSQNKKTRTSYQWRWQKRSHPFKSAHPACLNSSLLTTSFRERNHFANLSAHKVLIWTVLW